MLWLKAFHIIFVVTWFAGLFYLPRLFVYHAMSHSQEEHQRLCVMERRLLVMMHIGGALSIFFGGALLGWYLSATSDYLKQGWLHAKLALVFVLFGYHLWCVRLVQQFARGENTRSHRWYRYFNEFPGLILIAVVILVVVRPF